MQDLQRIEDITKGRVEVRIEGCRFIDSECGELRGPASEFAITRIVR